MEAAKNLQTAFATINGTLTTLRDDLAETNRQIGSINGRIDELIRMPISFEDYGIKLKALIDRSAAEHVKTVERSLFRSTGGEVPQNTLPWNDSDALGYFPDFFFGGNGSNAEMLCAFFGDIIYEKFMARAKESIGKRWGNTEYPSVAERRKMIAELTQQSTALKTKRAELEAQINEITGRLSI